MDTATTQASQANGRTAILIATGSRDDADGLRRSIGNGFGVIAASYEADKASSDFDLHRPRVLVLGFESVGLSRRYYQTLQRHAHQLQSTPHRSIVLCSKEELPIVFALCEQAVFDDYVLHWPLAYDGLRLRMAVLQALRVLGGSAAAAMQTRIAAQAVLIEEQAKRIGGLEAALAEAMTAPSEESAEASPAVRRQAVLVIDDDEMQYKLIRAQLRDQPYDLHWAPDAGSATNLLSNTAVDLILLDVELPGVAGPELLRQIRRDPRTARTPVIMVSSHHSRPIVTDAIAAGANDYIVKPVDRPVLRQKLETALAGD